MDGALNYFEHYPYASSIANYVTLVPRAICTKVDTDLLLGFVFIGLSKAFDTVSHRRRLLRLSTYRLAREIDGCLRDFLGGRIMRAKVNDEYYGGILVPMGFAGDGFRVRDDLPQHSLLDSVMWGWHESVGDDDLRKGDGSNSVRTQPSACLVTPLDAPVNLKSGQC
ncbi:hypothetical protein CRM22_003777 [Opisthorchis felineus]|uniref:Reverse transcriptase domain-containing protein n=1 Tax=Opisthorchis felineus TaxID=147828 RepID=A0A4S2LZM9_OPIFE|nr:hypothetical protein CRM22_003777 [Opisthorchis felineus]